MARRPRVRFAAPLVIVTACGQSPSGSLPVEPARELGIAATSVIDARPPIDAGLDAPPATIADGVTPRPGMIALRTLGRLVQPPGFISCHDFGPENRGCNPPRPYYEPGPVMYLRVEAVTPTADGVDVTVLGPWPAFAKGYLVVVEPRAARIPSMEMGEGGHTMRFHLVGGIDEATVTSGRLVLEYRQ